MHCSTASCVPAGSSSGGSESTGPDNTTRAHQPSTDTGGLSSGGAPDSTSSGAALCGNQVLDPGEECDGGEGCTGCTLDNYDCNPLNNGGCPEGEKCSYDDGAMEFLCLRFIKTPPGPLHDGSCATEDNFPQDAWCDVGLACMPADFSQACSTAAWCCVEFCDTRDPTFSCAQQGGVCRFWDADGDVGLEWLGVCGDAPTG